jgi:hypothetical protein
MGKKYLFPLFVCTLRRLEIKKYIDVKSMSLNLLIAGSPERKNVRRRKRHGLC